MPGIDMPSTLTGPLRVPRRNPQEPLHHPCGAPITSAQQAQDFIALHSDLNASHNCWAWKLGAQYRSSDDGEPGGTAGRPILSAIEAQDCDQVVVLVIRWYGGIQLGTGGLGARLRGWRQQVPARGRETHRSSARVALECACQLQRTGAWSNCAWPNWTACSANETFTANGVELVSWKLRRSADS
jgi:putative IMPACT (imprinted ancient) family translation regulator